MFILCRITWWPFVGKEVSWLSALAVQGLFYAVSIVFCSRYVLDVWGKMWSSILSVPDHCLFIYNRTLKIFRNITMAMFWFIAYAKVVFKSVDRQTRVSFCSFYYTFEPAHEIMALFVLRKLILQTHMRSHPVGLEVSFLVGPFVYFHTSCERTVKALARLRGYAGSPEPSLVAYVISTIIS